MIRWHRQLVRRKWTYKGHNNGDRLLIDNDLENLIIRLAKENPCWGYGKIVGELLKLGFIIPRTSILKKLHIHIIQPAPVRSGSILWSHLLSHYKDQILVTDFSLSKSSP